MKKKLLFLFQLSLSLLLLCLGCQPSDTPRVQPTSDLRISMEAEPQTLDPRRIRDLSNVTFMHTLYEGLMRMQANGEPAPAIAESVELSPDLKTYTFHLRQTTWSNGDHLTAHDFARTWKSLLEPQFPSPNAYQFYAIKGAQAAKEGKEESLSIGVRALDDSTLVVELNQPVPYFLRLLATPFFYPVHSSILERSPEKGSLPDAELITNGPFKLEKWSRNNELSVVPNPHYWDRKNVRLDKIHFIQLDNLTALHAFQSGTLDWTGSPMSTLPADALASIKSEGQLEAQPAAGVYLLRINTEKPPLNNVNIRRALALAIDRKNLVEHVLQGGQQPAFGLIPPSFIQGKPHFQDRDVIHARELFLKGLEEEGLTVEAFPEMTIHYSSNERNHKIAQVVQQQWKESLGIAPVLQSAESKVYFDRLKKQDYQVGIGTWFADFRDPISFLEIFKFKANGTNNTQWENPRFIALLDQSSRASDQAERTRLLLEAEGIILEEMPVIPLFFNSYNFIKNPLLEGVYFSELGYLDFKNAYFNFNSL